MAIHEPTQRPSRPNPDSHPNSDRRRRAGYYQTVGPANAKEGSRAAMTPAALTPGPLLAAGTLMAFDAGVGAPVAPDIDTASSPFGGVRHETDEAGDAESEWDGEGGEEDWGDG